MQRRPYKKYGKDESLICANPECDNISSKLYIVEDKIVDSLREWLKEYKIDYDKYLKENSKSKTEIYEEQINRLQKDLEKEDIKLMKIYEFYEEGTYTKEVFTQRSRMISDSIAEINKMINEYEIKIEEEKKQEENKEHIIPEIENVIDMYNILENAEEKNNLLKTVIEKVVYTKTKKAIRKDSDPTEFELDLYPKIAKIS